MFKDNFISLNTIHIVCSARPSSKLEYAGRMDLTICFYTTTSELQLHTRIAYITLYLSISKNALLHS